MMEMHYSDDELVDRLYEAGRTDDHLERCAECRARWEALLLRRREVLAPPEIPEAWLAAGRQRLERRLAESGASGWTARVLRPAFATLTLALMAILLEGPARQPAPVVASSDAQLLNEIYTLIQEDEPRGAIPVKALFEVTQ
jgi:anti-sigma factor RsiW